jgi:putative multiple sugar transport system substrate-binding protein
MTLKKLVAGLTVGIMALGFAACAEDDPAGDSTTTAGTETTAAAGDTLIGIAMPTQSLERWNNDGASLVEGLEKLGYKTQLQFADNKPDTQISQIQSMITNGAKVLVIAAVDGESLTNVLQEAADAGAKVIAYDRLIMSTANVDYYATFDNYEVGKMQGEYIVQALELATAEGPFNIEVFAGSPDDNNAAFFFNGAWDVLKPYYEAGKLVIQSEKKPGDGTDGWRSLGIQGWDTKTAQSEMENRLSSFYTDKKVDVVLSPNDSLALGIAQALESAGYAPGDDYPVLTGQDADIANVKNICAAKQSMTVWKDTRTLGEQVTKMVDQIIKGSTVDVNDTSTYNNGVKDVPSYLLPPQVVVKADVESVLVGSGFTKASDIGTC